MKHVLTIRQLWPALRTLLALTVILGLAYPFLVWGIGQVAFRDQANGSLIEREGQVVGSSLIGQNFEGEEWFHSRPSAAGENGYDGLASAASNLGPTNEDLLKTVQERKAAVAQENGVPESSVPADAVTASGSGLDPDISPAYAAIQVERVAQANGLDVAQVRQLVADHTSGRVLGFMGEPHVNVLELNLALTSVSAG
ncbi:K(+)-transporting ATPase subunit C [Tenggerimyces flavus]|uniref:Potassium-transporting ATPase KdpC subunit n=1 Tax=Tenggerimyces flavus TaxID=1708749 RepID=A0ABV7YM42_9ACTN|nr:K(+)-transporting ATPase subunit C [Tenggerimyces flavus]